MIVKISLPKYTWDSLIKYGDYKEHPDVIEAILRVKFIPRIKEFANDYRKGNIKWVKNYFRYVLFGKPCIISDKFILEIYSLLEKEGLFLEITEIEYLFSYSIMVLIAEDLDEFFGKSLTDVAHT